MYGGEVVWAGGRPLGSARSAGYGYTVGKPIGYGYVRNPAGVTAEYVLDGTYELEIATKRYSCTVSLQPLHDPGMTRIKS